MIFRWASDSRRFLLLSSSAESTLSSPLSYSHIASISLNIWKGLLPAWGWLAIAMPLILLLVIIADYATAYFIVLLVSKPSRRSSDSREKLSIFSATWSFSISPETLDTMLFAFTYHHAHAFSAVASRSLSPLLALPPSLFLYFAIILFSLGFLIFFIITIFSARFRFASFHSRKILS